MDDHLSKPFSLAGLRAVLERWLPASALRAGLPAEARSPSETRSAKEGSAAAGPAIELDSVPAARLDPSRLNAVRSLKSGGPDLAQRVIRLFLETTPSTMARLRVAASSGNAPEISRAAHSLRGGSRELGADRVGQLCQQIENLVRAGRVVDAAATLPELEREYEAVRRLLMEQIEPVQAGGAPSASSHADSIPRA